MSIDLEGWFIKTNKNVTFDRATYRIGLVCGPGESIFIEHGANNSYAVDDVINFMDQVSIYLKWANLGPEMENRIRKEAKQLFDKSIELGKPIVSDWI